MTENNAAQPGLTEAIRDAIRKAYDDGYNDAKMAPDNCSTYCVERAVRLDSAALLSKLRAEGVQAGVERALGYVAILHSPCGARYFSRITDKHQAEVCAQNWAAEYAAVKPGPWPTKASPVFVAPQAPSNTQTEEALAHLRTIAGFGGNLQQAKELAKRGLDRCAALASAPVAGEAQPVIHHHGFAADNQRLRAINESLDKQLEEVMTERDEYHDVADKLADAIADHLLVEIGEHSSSNCPWMRALDAIQNAAPQASEAVRNEALYLLREARALLPAFTTAEDIGAWSEKVRKFGAGEVIDIPPQADKDDTR